MGWYSVGATQWHSQDTGSGVQKFECSNILYVNVYFGDVLIFGCIEIANTFACVSFISFCRPIYF